jgi:hypothetical protein
VGRGGLLPRNSSQKDGAMAQVHFVMLPMDGGATHVAVNPSLVRCVQPKNQRQAEIYFDSSHVLVIEKTADQVIRDLEIAGR